MRNASCGITPEGFPIIGLSALSALVFAIIGVWPLAVLCLGFTFFAAHFFRDPERVTPNQPDIAVCPADGEVIRIEQLPDPFSGKERTRISIFMNVINVHVNRSPVEGTVKEIRYIPGTFLNVALDKASKDNERCLYDIEDAQGERWTMIQIAGLIARRIVCRVEAGDTLLRGERFGMIKFGSRVELYLPEGYSPAVAIGDKVAAGETVLARKAQA